MRPFLFSLLICVFLISINKCLAEDSVPDKFIITQDSIGIVKLGMPLKELEAQVKMLGYTIKKNKTDYILYDHDQLPLLTFTVFSSRSKTKPVRTIQTESSKFLLSDGTYLVENTLLNLSKLYPGVSIFRVAPRKDALEIVDFKDWPFSKSIVEGEYIIKYKTVLNKITDEYGYTKPVGVYENEFSLYTDQYLPEARIQSFQIEGIEPKVRF